MSGPATFALCSPLLRCGAEGYFRRDRQAVAPRQIRFIHFADVHLGFRQYGLAERVADFARAFGSAVSYCLDVKPDFVVLAGDLFDSKSIDPQTHADADAGLAALVAAQIPVVAVEGNHERWFRRGERSWLWQLSRNSRLRLLQQIDPKQEGLVWHPWTAERGHGAYTDIGPVRVFGVEYLGARLGSHLPAVIQAARETPANGVELRVGVLHTGVEEESPAGHGGAGTADLLALREIADYLALGHVHHRFELPSDQPWIFNPGALEAHNILEGLMSQPGPEGSAQERGLYDVTVDLGPTPRTEATFRDDVIVQRPFARVTVDVGRSTNFEDLRCEVLDAFDAPPESDLRPLVELVLRGTLAFDRARLDQPALLDILRHHYDPLHARVTVDLQRPTAAGLSVRSGSRSEIERDVVRGLIARHPAYGAEADKLADKTLELKRTVLEGQGEESLAPIVEATLS